MDEYDRGYYDALKWIYENTDRNNYKLLYIKMEEIEIKLEIFKAIANNSSNLCPDNKYIPPKGIANYTNEVYEILTKNI